MARRSAKRLYELDACALLGLRYGTERAITGVARAQHGALARSQLVALGLRAAAIDARVNRDA